MKKLVLIAVTLLALASCKQKAETEYEYPFRNPNLKVEERVEDLISRLTLREKVGMTMSSSFSVDRLGIPAYTWWSEACHGITGAGVTVFPQSIGLAASFDTERQFEIFTAVSDEARARWNSTEHNEFGVD